MNSLAKKIRGTRTGFTTGACCAAAARAVTLGLSTGVVPSAVETSLPNGQRYLFPVVDGVVDARGVTAVVVKDAGDDPDCTHGARMVARGEPLSEYPGLIRLQGGKGIGTVTRPGLGLPVGEPAINSVPRENIIANVREVAGGFLDTQGIVITLSVPGGEALAEKTLNPRLGIVGGISILGTTGIVYPYSTSAYRAAIVQAIQGAVATGLDVLALTTGRRTERYAMDCFPQWPPWSFVQMGDFVGAALEAASVSGVAHVVLVAMGGKLAKMAQGVKNTHAHKTVLDMDLVASLASQAGASSPLAAIIAKGMTVRFAVEEMARANLESPFYQQLATAALNGVRPWLGGLGGKTEATVLALDFAGRIKAWAGKPLP